MKFPICDECNSFDHVHSNFNLLIKPYLDLREMGHIK